MQVQLARTVSNELVVHAAELKNAFKDVFKMNDAALPLYGKSAGMSARQWWDKVIVESFSKAGVRQSSLAAHSRVLCDVVNEHFDSGSAYDLPDDVEPFMRRHPTVSWACVSGSHNTIRKALASKGLPDLGLSNESVWTSYDLGHDKQTDVFWIQVLDRLKAEGIRPDEALVVGDEIVDFDLPQRHGMKSLLLDRGNEHARPGYLAHKHQDSERIIISSLTEATRYIQAWGV